MDALGQQLADAVVHLPVRAAAVIGTGEVPADIRERTRELAERQGMADGATDLVMYFARLWLRPGTELPAHAIEIAIACRRLREQRLRGADRSAPCGATKAAAETGILLVHPQTVVARTSLIIGDGRSVHDRVVHELAAGTRDGVLFTDDIRCPVHVADLAAALLELVSYDDAAGVHHLAGSQALSRHELGILIARRDGLDASRLPTGLRAHSTLPGALDVRLDSRATQRNLRTTLRGAHQFCITPA